MFGHKSSAVQVPRWILIFRAFQLFFAIVILVLTAYCLSIFTGGPLKPPLISTLVIAVLTIIPVLALTVPLHLVQRKHYDPRIALLLDGFALLYWLATFAASASYHDIFGGYGDGFARRRRTWRIGVAVTVLAFVEFVLFLITTLAFIYYYNHHLAGTRGSGLPHTADDKAAAATGTMGTSATASAAGTGHAGDHGVGEHHQMDTMNHQSHNPVSGTTGPYGNTTQTSTGPPYPTGGPRQHLGGHGGEYRDGGNAGYGGETRV